MKKELTMSLVCLSAALLTGCSSSCCAAETQDKPKEDAKAKTAQTKKKFMTGFDAAKKKAKETKKPVLAVFTGSDWCPWCSVLETEIFATPDFQNWADENIILFEADYPQNVPQPDDVKKQNEMLAEEYSITGFPTIVIMTEEGKEIGRTGYRKGGIKKYLEHLERIIKSKL